MSGSKLFFGTSTGRSGTMLLANLLNSEEGVVCLHEGKFRQLEESGEQMLDFLTLENLRAYHDPDQAEDIFRRRRANMGSLAGPGLFGDVAYNYAPFVGIIPNVFGGSRLIVIFRDGREFVRSVVTDEDPDPTPVGWKTTRPTSKVERYIALGRLRPAPGNPLAAEWPTLSAVARNAWLWAETNRLILEGLDLWAREQVFVLKYEDLARDVAQAYGKVREFMGISGSLSPATLALLDRPINRRSQKVLPRWEDWSVEQKSEFARFAGLMMEKLEYTGTT